MLIEVTVWHEVEPWMNGLIRGTIIGTYLLVCMAPWSGAMIWFLVRPHEVKPWFDS